MKKDDSFVSTSKASSPRRRSEPTVFVVEDDDDMVLAVGVPTEIAEDRVFAVVAVAASSRGSEPGPARGARFPRRADPGEETQDRPGSAVRAAGAHGPRSAATLLLQHLAECGSGAEKRRHDHLPQP